MHLRATTRAQNINKVLGVDYAPTEKEDTELFDEQKNLMNSAFKQAFLTN